MKKTVYMHIGTPKTGSSAIQFFCANNRKILWERGISYPNMPFRFEGIGQYRNAHFLSHKIYQGTKRDYRAEKELQEAGYQEIEKQLGQKNIVVISDEHIWNEAEWDTRRFEDCKKHIEAMGAELKIIVYLRRQDLLVQSYWAQQVKEGMQTDFATYIQNKKYRYFQMDYKIRLLEIEKAVARENIIVRIYEKEQYLGKEQNIISDFMHILGENDLDVYQQEEMVKNTSLSGIYLELKRRMNQYPAYRTKKNFLVTILTRLQLEEQGVSFFDKGIYFDKESQKRFLEHFEESNSYIAKEYFQRDDGRLFMEEAQISEEGKREYTDKELLELCGRVITTHEESRQEKIDMIVEMREREREYKRDIQYLKETQSLFKRVLRKGVQLIRGEKTNI